MERRNLLLALFKKERKLYFSSSLYVTNSGIGYIISVLLAGAIAFFGVETLLSAFAETGEIADIAMLLPLINKLLPFVVSMPLCMMSASACAISMEGKNFWQLQILPVRAKDVYLAKLLWNLTVAAPFYVISVILVLIGAKPILADALHYILLPLVLLVFCIVFGLAANLWFPNFTWENETQVVKQGASVLIAMLGGMIAVIVPAVLAVVLQPASYTLYYFIIEIVILLITAVLYLSITKKELMTLPK